MDPSYFATALTSEDYASLDIDSEGIREILEANLQDPDTIPDYLKELAHLKVCNATETFKQCRQAHRKEIQPNN